MTEIGYATRDDQPRLHEKSPAIGDRTGGSDRYMKWLGSINREDLEPGRPSGHRTDDDEEPNLESWVSKLKPCRLRSDQTGKRTDKVFGSADEPLNRAFEYEPAQERFKNYQVLSKSFKREDLESNRSSGHLADDDEESSPKNIFVSEQKPCRSPPDQAGKRKDHGFGSDEGLNRGLEPVLAQQPFKNYQFWSKSSNREDLEPDRSSGHLESSLENISVSELKPCRLPSDQTGKRADNGFGSDEALNQEFEYVPAQDRPENYRDWTESYSNADGYSGYKSKMEGSCFGPQGYSFWDPNLRLADLFASYDKLNKPIGHEPEEERSSSVNKESFSYFSDQADHEDGSTGLQNLSRVFGPPKILEVGVYDSGILQNRPEENLLNCFRKSQKEIEIELQLINRRPEQRLPEFLVEQEIPRDGCCEAVKCAGDTGNEVKVDEERKEVEQRLWTKVIDEEDDGEDRDEDVLAKIDSKVWDLGRLTKQQERRFKTTKRCRIRLIGTRFR